MMLLDVGQQMFQALDGDPRVFPARRADLLVQQPEPRVLRHGVLAHVGLLEAGQDADRWRSRRLVPGPLVRVLQAGQQPPPAGPGIPAQRSRRDVDLDVPDRPGSRGQDRSTIASSTSGLRIDVPASSHQVDLGLGTLPGGGRTGRRASTSIEPLTFFFPGQRRRSCTAPPLYRWYVLPLTPPRTTAQTSCPSCIDPGMTRRCSAVGRSRWPFRCAGCPTPVLPPVSLTPFSAGDDQCRWTFLALVYRRQAASPATPRCCRCPAPVLQPDQGVAGGRPARRLLRTSGPRAQRPSCGRCSAAADLAAVGMEQPPITSGADRRGAGRARSVQARAAAAGHRNAAACATQMTKSGNRPPARLSGKRRSS